MKTSKSVLVWLSTLAGLIVLVLSLMSCGASESSSNGSPGISNTSLPGNTSTNVSISSTPVTSVVQPDATATATFNNNVTATSVANSSATATANIPTPTVEPTQPPHIVHNFSCTQQVYNFVAIPAYPGILTISFIQVMTSGDPITDYIKIQAVQGTSDTFRWTLVSTDDTQTTTITNPTLGAMNLGVTVLYYSKAVVNPDGSFGTQNFYAAGVCSSWASDGVPV